MNEMSVLLSLIMLGIGIGLFLVWRRFGIKKEVNNDVVRSTTVPPINNTAVRKLGELAIRVNQLPEDAVSEELLKNEIVNPMVVARLAGAVPNMVHAANNMKVANAVEKLAGKNIYEVIIPNGVKLVNSREMDGAKRGFFHVASKIGGHANLVEVDTGGLKANNNVAYATAGMQVASVIVGQYYMDQINNQLKEIQSDIKKISDFQDTEFRSKVFALITQIQKNTTYQNEILSNNEHRLAEIIHINDLEKECIQLLGQANLTLEQITTDCALNYKEYEKSVEFAQKWFVYQEALSEILKCIAEMKHTLHLGNVSKEQCCALLPVYNEQSEKTLEKLSNWHQENALKLNIKISENIRKRTGLDKAIHYIPGLINEEKLYCDISENVMNMINVQLSEPVRRNTTEAQDFFENDVRIVSVDGKFYYLPESTT